MSIDGSIDRSSERALHVAALPFPSPQGTQAAVAAMLDALAEAGRDARLLTYAHGAPAERPPRFTHLRLRRSFGDHSLRSGPSLAKIAQDLALARALRTLRPGLVVAHHVEAASAAWLAGNAPWVFVAHTALGPELPTYLPARGLSAIALSAVVERSGRALDRALVRGAGAALAVSPVLARALAAESDREVHWLPLPWPVPAPMTPRERDDARSALSLDPRDEVLLYAGNLDRYQGLSALWPAIAALRARRPRLRLVIATASDAREVPSDARVIALRGDEAQRRTLHAAADAVVVPREAEGGLPVKLIDALARGVPVACAPRATAGLALDGYASIDGDLSRAIEGALGARARVLAAEGPRFVARELSPARFLAALDGACATAQARAVRGSA